jgi:hypothetical protein
MPAPGPAYVFTLRDLPSEDLAGRLLAIPGVRSLARWGGKNKFDAPLHVGWLAERVLASSGIGYGVEVRALPAPKPTWEQVCAHLLQGGEIKPEWLDNAKDFQREGVCFGAYTPGCAFWWPGGAGKTLGLTLWALIDSGPVVVVTKAAVRMQWDAEVRKFSSVEPYVIRPRGKSKKEQARETLAQYVARKQWRNERIFVIVAWTDLPRHVDELIALQPKSVGWDEIHTGKSQKRGKMEQDPSKPEDPDAKVFVPAKNIVAAASKLSKIPKRRCGTTATAVKNRLKDLWGQLDLIWPWGFGTYRIWTTRYAQGRPSAWNNAWDANGMSNVDELNDVLTFVVHRVSYKQSHAGLPPKRRQSMQLLPADCGDGWSVTRTRQELKAAALRGPSAVLETRLASSAAMKRPVIVDLVVEHVESGNPVKVCIFDERHDNVEAIGKDLKKKLKGVDVFVVHGGNTTPETREKVRVAYMTHPGPCVLVGTGSSLGTGYNLDDTDIAIFSQLPWTGGDLHQWEQRFSRASTKKSVLIIFPICVGTIDEHVSSRLLEKLPAMELVVGDTETASAQDAITGADDKDKLAADFLAMLESIDYDSITDDHT